MNIVQIKQNNKIICCIVNGNNLNVITGEKTTYDIANLALSKGQSLTATITELGTEKSINYQECLENGLVTIPIHHPDANHFFVSGTGLTHLGSADARDKMHSSNSSDETDSIKMFRWGIENGKPETGSVGVKPEWFYKGDGTIIRAHNEPLNYPNFAKDGSEEPEVCGLYINDKNGVPHRIGFTIGNEYSDHTTEKENYLYLAHSKLRDCSLAPELRLGDLPKHIIGKSSIIRDGKTIWEQEFLSGEDNMSHTIENIEHHHFKYDLFCRPGDLNAHFLGTATLSYADGIEIQDGDIMRIKCDDFGKALENPLAKNNTPESCVHVKKL